MKIDMKQFSKPCTCGKTHKIEVESIYIEQNATRFLPGILKQYSVPVFICDTNTKKAALRALDPFFDLYNMIELESEHVIADHEHVDKINQAFAAEPDILIAVGSGTIHDLVRYISFQRSIPFISYPTAASVDGFLSTGAAMTWFGLKKTFPARSPMTVIADTDIFAEAPYRLTAAGIADLLGKYTALADWKIAHLVSDEDFCRETHDLVMQAVIKAEEAIPLIQAGHKDSMETLMYALLLSGLAMQMTGNSRPASGAEHHLSHLWEMHVINPPIDALHGEKVSVGLLLCLEQYEKILTALENRQCIISSDCAFELELMEQNFSPSGLFELILEENQENILTSEVASRFQRRRAEIIDILKALPERDSIRRKLESAGCPTALKHINLPEHIRGLSLSLSPYTKRRLTMMRLCKLIDCIDDASMSNYH